MSGLRDLDTKTKQILEYIKSQVAANTFPPTQREIAAETGMALSSVRRRLVWLEEKGYIWVHEGVSRGITILSQE